MAHAHDHAKVNQQRKPWEAAKPKLPVTVLTGYLGAGKTTLLNYLLREQRDKKLAVIENEVGEVSVDDALVEQKHHDAVAELVVLDNGCICCTIRNDLVTTLTELAAKYQDGLQLDGVLIELTGVADPAPVVQTFFIHDSVREAFRIDNVVALVDAKYAIEKLDESKGDPENRGTANAQIAFSSTVLLNKVDLADEEELKRIESRIKQVNSTARVIRCQNAVVPVDHLFNVNTFDLAKVLQEQYMDEEEFNTFYEPKMDRSVSNVGIRCPGALNPFLFEEFLDEHMGTEEKAMDFMRVKAVLNLPGKENKFVLQCIHMIKNQGFAGPWEEGEPRENRIIFIGRGMQQRRQALTDAFKECITKPLRFEVGTEVRARCGPGEEDYRSGNIIAHWDECNAYRIKLLDGDEVRAPHDSDQFVREGFKPKV